MRVAAKSNAGNPAERVQSMDENTLIGNGANGNLVRIERVALINRVLGNAVTALIDKCSTGCVRRFSARPEAGNPCPACQQRCSANARIGQSRVLGWARVRLRP